MSTCSSLARRVYLRCDTPGQVYFSNSSFSFPRVILLNAESPTGFALGDSAFLAQCHKFERVGGNF